ncbi:Calx-beta domain-containing protein [Niveispirillum fermenti]|uniref:Calx-beta domain-containing protein n=1 Tax=Niveispirillum fermenti TaxID=1233113 RepID=UPI003A876C71
MTTITLTEDTILSAGTYTDTDFVLNGHKLTIGPGVTLEGGSIAQGDVRIAGTAEDPVRLVDVEITSWAYAASPLDVSHAIFEGGTISRAIGGGAASITDSVFIDTIFYSRTGGVLSIDATENDVVLHNNAFIRSYPIQILGGTASSSVSITDNLFLEPFNGRMLSIGSNGEVDIAGNNFYADVAINFQTLAHIANARNNYYGTDDPAAIRGQYQFQYQPLPGDVDVSGFLTEPNPDADAFALPTVALSVADVVEGDAGQVFTPVIVSLSSAVPYAVTLTYHMAGITATDGVDYQPQGGVMTIPAGQTSVTLSVAVHGDLVPEGPETFKVELSGLKGALFENGEDQLSGTVTIIDDDADNLIQGTGGDDLLTGTDGPEFIRGGAGNDTIQGNGGDDIITGGAGNDRIDGGRGVDAAIYSGQRDQYTLTHQGHGVLEVRDDRAGSPDGTDLVSNVEVLVFDRTAHFTVLMQAVERYDEQAYLAFNPDVAAAVEAGIFVNGYDHWTRFGINEGRMEINLVDETFYRNQNPDVAEAISNGYISSGREHWEAFGRYEGRAPNILFNADYYLATHADLTAAFGTDARAALSHWLHFGIDEGRDASAWFDSQAYRAANPDLAATDLSMVEHFLIFGYREGRAATVDADWLGLA